MSARKIDINPKVEVQDNFDQLTSMGGDERTSLVVSGEPIAKNGLKGLIEQIFQFVSVGGDFV